LPRPKRRRPRRRKTELTAASPAKIGSLISYNFSQYFQEHEDTGAIPLARRSMQEK
jgi:hypothetical protein